MGRNPQVSRTAPILCALLGLAALALAEPAAAAVPGFQIRYYTADDGSLQPYSLYVPNPYDPGTPHPLVINMHGWGGRFAGSVSAFKQTWADTNGWLLASVDGRGSQNYDGPGEDDVLRVLAEVAAFGNVDPDRVYLEGFSMGGHGCYRLGLRYPDVFAAVAPSAGWTTYTSFYSQYYEQALAPKLPGYLDPTRRPHLEAASSLFSAENAKYLWMRMTYGGADATNPPINQELMIAALDGFGYTTRRVIDYNVLRGHSSANISDVYNFLDGKSREAAPATVVWTTNRLRYGGAYWVRVDALRRTGEWARIQADVSGATVDVTTANVAGYTLRFDRSPVPVGSPVTVITDGLPSWSGNAPAELYLAGQFDAANRLTGFAPVPGPPTGAVKRPGIEGPISEVLRRKFLIVYGTNGTPAENQANMDDAYLLAAQWNGTMILHWSSEACPPARLADWFYPPYPFTPGAYTAGTPTVEPVDDATALVMDLTPYDLVLFGDIRTNLVVPAVGGSFVGARIA